LILLWNKGYAPVIEYCGGTEIGGSFLGSTLVQPNIPSMFSSPILGSEISLLDPDSNQVISTSAFTSGPIGSTAGELVIHPPSVGLSTVLLNRNHFDCYFAGMPKDVNGRLLRRHGDAMEVIRGKNESLPYYRALGRCDDTMNLGGIKVSSVEIERVCNTLSIVKETAAIAVTASGPCKLVVYVVLHDASTNVPSESDLKTKLQQAIKRGLNPLFGIYAVVITDALPRTASNKIMRRLLRDNYIASNLS
jgi:acetyl-CoA synthetase